MDHNHQGPEDVHSDCDKPLLALSAGIFDRKREWIIEHSVALGKGHAVLPDVCRILLRVEIGGYVPSICTLCIYVNVAPHLVEH